MLQAAAAVQADIPASTTAAAAADKLVQDKQPAAAAAATRPLRSSCPAGSAPPEKVATHKRKSRRHSTGQGLLPSGQGRPGAAPAHGTTAPAAADEEECMKGVQVVQCMDRHVTFETSDQGAARRHSGKQGRADPHSPAVTAQQRHQPSKGAHRADPMQGRASLSSPAVGSGGPRQHRRASLGGGGVLPLEGHSFLLTGYDDDKQKKVVTQRIIKLGGLVLEDIPKPPVLFIMLTGQLMCTVLPCFARPCPTMLPCWCQILSCIHAAPSWHLKACFLTTKRCVSGREGGGGEVGSSNVQAAA